MRRISLPVSQEVGSLEGRLQQPVLPRIPQLAPSDCLWVMNSSTARGGEGGAAPLGCITPEYQQSPPPTPEPGHEVALGRRCPAPRLQPALIPSADRTLFVGIADEFC